MPCVSTTHLRCPVWALHTWDALSKHYTPEMPCVSTTHLRCLVLHTWYALFLDLYKHYTPEMPCVSTTHLRCLVLHTWDALFLDLSVVYLLLHCVVGDETIHEAFLALAVAVDATHRLRVVARVPRRVEHDHAVRTDQVDPEAARPEIQHQFRTKTHVFVRTRMPTVRLYIYRQIIFAWQCPNDDSWETITYIRIPTQTVDTQLYKV